MAFDLPITLPQALAIGILLAMMSLFAWGKLRYDLVALAGLLAAVLVGIVPNDKAFSGFSDDIVIIVASALDHGGARRCAADRAVLAIQAGMILDDPPAATRRSGTFYRKLSSATPSARLTPAVASTESGCSTIERLNPPTSALAPTPTPSDTSPLAPT